jgi:hypothetical protein
LVAHQKLTPGYNPKTFKQLDDHSGSLQLNITTTLQVISYGCGHKGGSAELKVYVSHGKERILEIEKGSTTSHCLENWLWKRLWTGHKTHYRMNNE